MVFEVLPFVLLVVGEDMLLTVIVLGDMLLADDDFADVLLLDEVLTGMLLELLVADAVFVVLYNILNIFVSGLAYTNCIETLLLFHAQE